MSQPNNKVIVVVGGKSAGKSAIVHRLIDEKFDFGCYRPTVDDCYNVAWKLPDGQYLQIQFIDTAAWNEFPAMQNLYIKMSHLVLVVYDVVSPTWRESIFSIVNGVRQTKSDADIVVVGNKCDRLKATDEFTPTDLPEVVSQSCVGHVYTSALTQQGINGLRQLILCSKSQLTIGHYVEFSHVPKKKKLKKKLTGLSLLLNLRKKDKTINNNNTGEEKVEDRYREPVIYPEQPRFIQYDDITSTNFDRLFDKAHREQVSTERLTDSPTGDVVYRRKKNRSRLTQSTDYLSNGKDRRMSAFDLSRTSDYSSPGSSPGSTNDLLLRNSIRPNVGYRKSIDFSQLTLDYTSPSQSPELSRFKSRSSAFILEKKEVSVMSSVSTVMSDSSNESVPYYRRSSTTSSTADENSEYQGTAKIYTVPNRLRQNFDTTYSSSFDESNSMTLNELMTPIKSSHLYNSNTRANRTSKSIEDVLQSTARLKIKGEPLSDLSSPKRKAFICHHVRHKSDGHLLLPEGLLAK